MKLNWFSPLPPARSAIASYAATVLPELRRHADVTVWSEGPADDVGEIRFYNVHAPPWEEINHADVSIYHIGNHALFHAGIWDLSRRHPGVVVLHDARLQEFVAGCATIGGDMQGYLDIMRRYYGDRGVAAVRDVWSGVIQVTALVEEFPLTAAFVDTALGSVVHSADALDLASQHTTAPILRARLPYGSTRSAVHQRTWQAPFRLIAFGFLGGERGLGTVLAALAALPERDAFHFDVYGELAGAEQWSQRIHSMDLTRHVTLHGFVPAATLAAALDDAHLVLNLRYPSRGEASFSLLQAWDHAVPVLAYRIGAFAEVPPTCLAFAQPQQGRDDVIAHLRALRANPETYRAIGAAGREYLLRHHDPATYAEQLVRFAASTLAHRHRVTALVLAERAAAALSAVAGAHPDDRFLHRVGAAIVDLTDANSLRVGGRTSR